MMMVFSMKLPWGVGEEYPSFTELLMPQVRRAMSKVAYVKKDKKNNYLE